MYHVSPAYTKKTGKEPGTKVPNFLPVLLVSGTAGMYPAAKCPEIEECLDHREVIQACEASF
jgi:hypothetical protein